MKFLHVGREIDHQDTKPPSFFVLTWCLYVLVVKSLFHFGSGSSGLGDDNIGFTTGQFSVTNDTNSVHID